MAPRYRVLNTTRNTLLGDRIERADSFGARFKGLMGRRELPFGSGLHIEPCTSIHTFFMKIDIDVLFLSPQLEVLDIVSAMKPGRMSKYYPRARSVLELPAGCAGFSQCQVGDALRFEPETS
jgi:uncharacterized protein